MNDPQSVLAFSIRDACAAIGIGRTKLYALINEGKLTAVKVGRRTLVTVASIKALLGTASCP